jgi:hypothetical protein
MSLPRLSTVQLLVKVLFCALIGSTAEIYGIPNPKKNAKVSRSTFGIGKKFAGTIQMKSDVFRYI